MSSSSDISFGWEEVNTCSISRDRSYGIQRENVPNKFAGECASSNDNINMASESSDSDDSVEGKEKRNLGVFDVTAASKEESSLKGAREVPADSKDLEVKPDLSKKVPEDTYRKKKTHDMSESEYSYSHKLAKDSCKKKKNHVLKREDSESDREMPSLVTDEDYGTVKVGDMLKLENLTEEEEIWMVQCPVALDPRYLENKELVFGGTSEFTLQHSTQRYETASYIDRIKPVLCLLPSRNEGIFKAKVLQPKGLMVIMEKVQVPELKITLPKQSDFQIPKGLKVRHPLFGRDYEQELEVRKQFMSQNRRMVHEDLLMQLSTFKEEKKKKRSVKADSTSEGTSTRYEREKWQIHDDEEQESYKKKKEKNRDAKEHKRKRKLDKDIFEGADIVYGTKRRKKEKHENIH